MLWQDGRRDEAIQVLEQGIAMEKGGLPAVIPTERPADRITESGAIAAAASAAPPRRRFRPAAIGLLAGAMLLLAGAALWSGRDGPAGELAEHRPEIAGEPVQGGTDAVRAAISPPAVEVRPAADAPKPASKPPVAEPASLAQPAPPKTITPSRPVTATAEPRRTTPALPVVGAAVQREVRVPKGRPAPQAAAVPAARPPPGRAPRSRLAEQRAAAERYAARRRAAAEQRASAQSGGPSVLLGGRGLP